MPSFGQGQFPTIGVVNLATVDLGLPLGKTFTDLVAALQKSLDEHFTLIYGYPAKLLMYPDLKSIPADNWQFILMDNADVANALGYHDISKKGQPVSYVFVKTTLDAWEQVCVTCSHELFEMILDPFANGYFENAKGVAYAYEASDAVEEDTFDIDGIAMSNFVYQSWFEDIKHPPGTKFDHLGRLKKQFSMTKGGYVITKKGGRVKEIFGSKTKAKRFAREHRVGHRSEYRKVLAGQKAQVIHV
jgi:hypothetical protein